MPDLKDLHDNIGSAVLQDPASVTATTYSKYIDTQGYNGVEFELQALGGTCDGTHYLTPAIYGYTGVAPQTASGYSACAAGELNGTLAAINDTDSNNQRVGLKQHLYRYYHIKWTESGTATVVIAAKALLSSRNQPAGDDTFTTGSVS